jgi:hypothetical protein
MTYKMTIDDDIQNYNWWYSDYCDSILLWIFIYFLFFFDPFMVSFDSLLSQSFRPCANEHNIFFRTRLCTFIPLNGINLSYINKYWLISGQRMYCTALVFPWKASTDSQYNNRLGRRTRHILKVFIYLFIASTQVQSNTSHSCYTIPDCVSSMFCVSLNQYKPTLWYRVIYIIWRSG